MYELSLSHYARAIGIALVIAVLGGIAGYLLPLPAPSRMYLFGMLIALVAGMGGGALAAGTLDRATRGKRGRQLQLIAAAGFVAAGLIRFVLLDYPWRDLPQDFAGLILIGAAIVTVWGRLR